MRENGKINGAVFGGFVGLAFVMAAFTGIAEASPIWGTHALPSDLTDSRDSSSGGGVTASVDWDGGDFSISWVITQDPTTKLWTYQYTQASTKEKHKSSQETSH